MTMPREIIAIIDYQDAYVQPLLTSALRKYLPLLTHQDPTIPLPTNTPTLQWRSYEMLDFLHALSHHSPQSPHVINAYIIRKALTRKHYLSHTVLSYVTKHPSSILKSASPVTVNFELDYAEFLDEALVEAFELLECFRANEGMDPAGRKWWILKPSMSDRGMGIRLFSCEEELRGIFEKWEVGLSESDRDEDEDDGESETGDRIVTSHLRHFVAQRYIGNPLLVSEAPFDNRKFHIRTYVVAAGALKVYVYDQMLSLFASEPYESPWKTGEKDSEANSGPTNGQENEDILQRMRNVHLTNTCVQTANGNEDAKSNNVFLLSQLPMTVKQHNTIRSQISDITAELFRAALALPTNFQPIPQSFELFGLDFVCSTPAQAPTEDVRVHLLEVNAFPDFAQTGNELKDVVKRLFEETVKDIIAPLLRLDPLHSSDVAGTDDTSGRLKKVLDVDAGRR